MEMLLLYRGILAIVSRPEQPSIYVCNGTPQSKGKRCIDATGTHWPWQTLHPDAEEVLDATCAHFS
jgi:hypothetical protein